MKNIFAGIVVAASVLFISATVWEGAVMVDSSEAVPGTYSIATNAFPRNTVVDITNLENGKIARVLVVSGIESTSLLAILSQNAADSVELRASSFGRMRIIQPSDDIAFSHFKLGPLNAAPPVSEIAAAPEDSRALETSVDEPVAFTAQPLAVSAAPATPGGTDRQHWFDFSEELSDLRNMPVLGEPDPAIVRPQETATPFVAPARTEERPPANYVLVPTAERPPEAARIAIPVVAVSVQSSPAPAAAPSAPSPFQAPLIDNLESGKWYVQLAAYTQYDHVEDEISRIGTVYPLAIQNIGSDIKPMFRVLLGPLSQGESGAMLQRFKSLGYTDAFIRH